MRRFFGIVVRVLILLVVGLAALLTSMGFAIHGREVQVPNLVGLAPSDAERSANSGGLLLIRESRFYSSEIPEGRIVSQLPPAGTRVRSGWSVRVAESLGPQRIVIPDVVGQSPRAAEINLRRRGLELNGVATINLPGAQPGQVIAQSPAPNAQEVSSPKVGILLSASAGPTSFVMPDLTGVTLAQASIAITDAGLRVGNVNTIKPEPSAATAPPNTSPPTEPTIVHQTPSAGQRVSPGATVTLDVVR